MWTGAGVFTTALKRPGRRDAASNNYSRGVDVVHFFQRFDVNLA